MHVPSGRELDVFDLAILRQMHSSGFVRRSEQPFTLKSGIKSHVYVFGREDLTENPKLMNLVGQKVCSLVTKNRDSTDKQPCFIGIPTAGTVMAIAASLVSCTLSPRHDYACRLMREAKKSHGAHQTWVNGKPEPEKHTYWQLDNVSTDGESKIEANAKMVEDGYPPYSPCLIWIDRQQGAVQRLHKVGFKRVVVAYNLLDITYAYGELGLWPKETVKAVEEEIAAHQFK